MRSKIVTADEAIALIHDGDTLASTGFVQGTVKLSGVPLGGSGGSRVSVPNDDTPRRALCRLPLPCRTHRIRGVALFPLPVEPAHG